MKCLLDTHIWLWSVLDPRRLGTHVADVLADPESEIWLSSMSVWELGILVRKKRFELSGSISDYSTWVQRALSLTPLREAVLNHEICRLSHLMDLPHQDPVDRILAATAKTNDLTLVTADELLLKCRDISTMANR
jgi:PIN domain nuclease of toxin-antitoxin system